MFQLMLKDKVCVEFELLDNRKKSELKWYEIVSKLPMYCDVDKLLYWLERRNISYNKTGLYKYASALGMFNLSKSLEITHGISLNDCYWVRRKGESINWEDVSPYRNNFHEGLCDAAFLGDATTFLPFNQVTVEYGTDGAYDKCWRHVGSAIHMYKRGTYIATNSGMEPYCEVLASKVYHAMKAGIPYELVTHKGHVASKCDCFCSESRSFLQYKDLPESKSLHAMIKFYDNLNNDLFRRILICDALTLNPDRHAGNHGVYYDPDILKITGIATGFDYNVSLLPYMTNDDFAAPDFKINFFGCQSSTGHDFIKVARELMTPEIRKDLMELRGINLELPWYNDKFTKERAEWMTIIVNTQINNILFDGAPKLPKITVSNISNCMKYRIKMNLNEDQWRVMVPKLMEKFGIRHMDELEREIGKLL